MMKVIVIRNDTLYAAYAKALVRFANGSMNAGKRRKGSTLSARAKR